MRPLLASLLVLALVAPGAAWSQGKQIGETSFVRGGVTQEPAGGAPRIIGRGSPLYEGDVLRTGPRSLAVLKFADGTRTTLRSNSTFTVEDFEHDEAKPDEEQSAIVRLFKGGMRMVTGLIGKRNNRGVSVRTNVATIGIRGTDFSARLCAEDCQAESRTLGRGRETGRRVKAKVVFLSGTIEAHGIDGRDRNLALGGSILEGDVIETGPASVAVVTFRDGSRSTLREQTSMKIERYRYDEQQPERSSAVVRFLKGSMRMVSGLIARARPENHRVRTNVATIGIRGTDFELRCSGDCGERTNALAAPPDPIARLLGALIPSAVAQAGNGVDVFTRVGTVVWELPDGGTFLINAGQAVFYDGVSPPVVYPTVPVFFQPGALPTPEPDPSIGDDTQLFGGVEQQEPEFGLYVEVVDGEVEVADALGNTATAGADDTLHVGATTRQVVRIVVKPPLLPTADPTIFDDPQVQQRMQLLDDADGGTGESTFECVIQ